MFGDRSQSSHCHYPTFIARFLLSFNEPGLHWYPQRFEGCCHSAIGRSGGKPGNWWFVTWRARSNLIQYVKLVRISHNWSSSVDTCTRNSIQLNNLGTWCRMFVTFFLQEYIYIYISRDRLNLLGSNIATIRNLTPNRGLGSGSKMSRFQFGGDSL